MSHFEIEVKSLLGEKINAEALKNKMKETDIDCFLVSANVQLNHYFKAGDINNLFRQTQDLFTTEQRDNFSATIERGEKFSVRTRQKDDEVLLVVKASIDDGTSENTVKRMEFEEAVDVSLAELDQRVLAAGYVYQAKWSREREEYKYKETNVCIDKNAGYGYLVEFEKIIDTEQEADKVRYEIDEIMNELGVVELDQDRLARMFDFYNNNWADYYGTDKTFIIE